MIEIKLPSDPRVIPVELEAPPGTVVRQQVQVIMHDVGPPGAQGPQGPQGPPGEVGGLPSVLDGGFF